MSEGALVEVGQGSKYGSEEAFAVVATSTQFLPRLQLYGANSEYVKEGKIGMGRWGLVRTKDQLEDQGPECNILAVSWRPKALEILKAQNEVLAIYNPQSLDFKRIASRADNEKDSGCMYGPEYLVFLPNSGGLGDWATLFLGNKTNRREAPKVKARLGLMSTLKVHLIRNKQYSWHGPICVPCSVIPPIVGTEEFKIALNKERDVFNQPPESEKELAPEDERPQ